MCSIPGISTLTAALLIGTIGDVSRWTSSKSLARTFGFYGEIRQSGGSSRLARGGGGNRDAKSSMVHAALLCVQWAPRHPNDIADAYERHRSRGVPPRKAAYKAASKLTRIVFGCLGEGTTYRYRGGSQPTTMNHVTVPAGNTAVEHN